MNKSILCVQFLLCVALYGNTQETYTQFYNLDFIDRHSLVESWIGPISCDTSTFYKGKNPLVIIQENYLNSIIPPPLDGNLTQFVWLPEIQSKTATISLSYNTIHLESAHMLLYKVNNNYSVISIDTLNLSVHNDEWRTTTKEIAVDGIRGLLIHLAAKGSDSLYYQYFYLDEIDIRLDGVAIDTYPLYNDTIVPEKERIVSLSFQDLSLYKDIDYLKNKRIIAIGETNHGCEEFVKCALQLMKNQIENNGCNLVLMEVPTELMLSVNFFIHGHNGFDIDSLQSDDASGFFYPATIEFILWLRDFCKQTGKKVSVYGIDAPLPDTQRGIRLIHSALHNWNKTMHSPIVDSLCLHIHKSEGPLQLEKTRQYVNNYTSELVSILGADVFFTLQQCLETMEKISQFQLPVDEPKFHRMRDRIMYENTLFFEKLVSPDKVVIYTHFEHANHMSIGYGYSYGHYMKEYWHDDYGCIGLFAEKGVSLLVNEAGVSENRKIGDALPNSFERFLAKENSDYYFYLLPEQDNSVFSIRSIGVPYRRRQFKALLLSKYIDAAIFIREETPANIE